MRKGVREHVRNLRGPGCRDPALGAARLGSPSWPRPRAGPPTVKQRSRTGDRRRVGVMFPGAANGFSVGHRWNPHQHRWCRPAGHRADIRAAIRAPGRARLSFRRHDRPGHHRTGTRRAGIDGRGCGARAAEDPERLRGHPGRGVRDRHELPGPRRHPVGAGPVPGSARVRGGAGHRQRRAGRSPQAGAGRSHPALRLWWLRQRPRRPGRAARHRRAARARPSGDWGRALSGGGHRRYARDIAAARAIGAESLAVATGSFSVEALRGHGATYAVPDLADPAATAALLGTSRA